MAENKRLELVGYYNKVFNTQEGREVLKDLRNFCQFEKALFKTGSPSAINDMLVNEGKRIVFLHIQKILNTRI